MPVTPVGGLESRRYNASPSLPRNPASPGFGFMPDRLINSFVGMVYDRGEGMRYAFEQTLGYTVPRTVQQLWRTRSITGKNNDLAGLEMFVRDTAADFTDTFLGGLVATYGIGKVADKLGHTYVSRNMGESALNAFQNFIKNAAGVSVSRSHFYENVEHALRNYATNQVLEQQEIKQKALATRSVKNVVRMPKFAPLHLQRVIKNLGVPKGRLLFSAKDDAKVLRAAHDVARILKLPNLDVTLAHRGGKLEIGLTDLVRDLWYLQQPNPRITSREAWGEQMGYLLKRTKQISRLQMAGMGVSLLASLAVPFAIRMMTKRLSGQDAFPGTSELEKYYHLDELPEAQKSEGRFRPFPWLADTLKAQKLWPLVGTLGFFGVVTAAAARRFHVQGLNFFKAKDWFKVYKFDRGFPFTTVPQMELTYGMLCAMRLAASRNDAEARESFIRDCMLGWPTLTYFNKLLRGAMSRYFDKRLEHTFKMKHLLIKPGGDLRTSGINNEMKSFFFRNMGMERNAASKIAGVVRTYQNRIAFTAGMISLLLIAFVEPQLAIWLTNSIEMKKIQGRLDNLKQDSVRRAEAALRSPSNQFDPNVAMASAVSELPEEDRYLPIPQVPVYTDLPPTMGGYGFYGTNRFVPAINSTSPAIPASPTFDWQAFQQLPRRMG
ncbi:MAG: hypothetical protein KC475_09155 [Cyanobacteria bacterium HKST-UBA03]|nr:hypothetical protein [Cyanobacteria bacterium HKST-UBA03]